uniref:BRO1 domain-containing protein n=1 Tax=Palpitomonas bilix TaxID=652834 RepID=A0A7S3DLU9_9EUKA|mmetsp:Transcript_43279/g.112461  ORF Transcript_43279/g.112461 Transcript_43279/m.112461 type:complete len:388 (+) Transcript_43279:296-1459(+)
MSRLLCHHSILALPLTPIRLARLENSVQTFSDRYEAGIARAAKQRNDILSSQLAGDPATASYPPLGPIMQALDVYVPLLVFVRDLFEQSKETIFHETFLFHWTSVMSKRKKPFEMFGWQFEMMNVLQLKAIVYGIAAGVEVENAATDALMEVAVKKAVNHLLQAAGLHVYMKERLLKEFEILPKKRPMELLAPSHDVMKHMYVGEAAGVLLHKAKARDMMAAVKAKLATTAFRSFSSSLDALRQLGSEERDFDPSLRRYIKFSASAYLATALIYLAADWIEKEEKDKATSALQLAYAKVTSLSAYARESAKEKEIVSMDFERRHASIMQMWMAHADRVGRDMCEKKVKKEEEEESIISTLPDVVKLSVNEYILPPSAIKVSKMRKCE